jgi:hypothetical protein
MAGKIGLISSINLESRLLNHFKTGVHRVVPGTIITGSQPQPPSYDHQTLATAVQTFANDTTVALIVTVGGVTSAMAAVPSSKPWVAIIGGTPQGFPQPATSPDDNNKFWGGVSLETFNGSCWPIPKAYGLS